jgi:hypothetical protein
MINSIVNKVLSKRKNFIAQFQLRKYSRYEKHFDVDFTFSQAANYYPNRNELHAYAHHYYNYICPKILREHRKYFSNHGRGFGEDAFHAMWWLLIREFQPVSCLEIGVYRGQVISLWALINKLLGTRSDIHGISPFAPIGDSVSKYMQNIDYMEDTKKAFVTFELEAPILVSALSTDTIAVDHICGREWDLIYIDGSHDFEVVTADYKQCVKQLRSGGLLVMDDSSLGTDFNPPLFSFAGHPGPSLVVQELAMKELSFIGAVGHNNIFLKK